MGSFSTTGKNKMLDGSLRGTGGLAGAVYAKLHTGDPGGSGTSNAATETTRKVLSLAAASSGSVATNAEVRWTNVAANETYSYISFWDQSSGGNFIGSDDLPTPVTVTAGDEFFVSSGDITLSLT